MTTIDRIRVPWVGGRGGDGVSTFYALDASLALDPIHDFFDSQKALIPTPIVWSFAGSGDQVNAETGVLVGSWTATSQANVAATGSNTNVADPVGACVKWLTADIHFGHRVTGRTFMVPGIKDLFADGTINDSVVTSMRTAALAMVTAASGNLIVWTRPFAGTPEWTDVHGVTHPARAAHDGAIAQVTDAAVPDKAVVLRSRRD